MSMLMQLGTRAMFAAYAQLQTTGQNIANASTVGYSRQQVILGTAPGHSRRVMGRATEPLLTTNGQ